jgi:hypothetical protein
MRQVFAHCGGITSVVVSMFAVLPVTTSTNAVHADIEPVGTPPPAAFLELDREIVAFGRDATDDEAWARLQRVATTTPNLGEAPQWEYQKLGGPGCGEAVSSAMFSMANRRLPAVSRCVADLWASGVPGPWAAFPERLVALRYGVVQMWGDRSMSASTVLTANERAMLIDGMSFLAEHWIGELFRIRMTNIYAWPGWTDAERQSMAWAYLVKTNFRGFQEQGRILGRRHDGLNDQLLAFAVDAWNKGRTFEHSVLLALCERGDKNVGSVLRSMKADALANGDCGGLPCAELMDKIDKALAVDEIRQADGATLLAIYESDLATAWRTSAEDGLKRSRVVNQLLRLHMNQQVSTQDFRAAYFRFNAKFQSGLQPDQPWSMPWPMRVQHMVVLEMAGVLDPPGGVQRPQSQWPIGFRPFSDP